MSAALTAAREGVLPRGDGASLAWRAVPGRPGAPRLALVHSLAQEMGFWDGVVAELAGAAEILLHDCRGHGRSARGAAPFTVEMFADDLAALLDHLGWDRAVVAGCSMGGCVAQAFGARHAARAAALLLVDTTAWYGPKAPEEWRERAATATAKGMGALAAFQTTRWFGDAFRAARPDLVQARLDAFLASDLQAYAWSCALLGEADLRPHLPGLRMPVGVVVGEQDYATPVAMAIALRDAIPGATLTTLPAARHLTPVERPEAIAAEIRALLARI